MTKNAKSDANCTFFKIERLLKTDLKKLMEIEKISFSHPWNLALFESELDNTSSTCLKILTHDSSFAGYIILRDIVDETHILSIAIHPNFRRKGLAQTLIETCEKNFCCGKILLLEVRVSNEPAIELYKKIGFKPLYVRKRYYPDGEDAIVMEKKPCVTAE